MATTSNVQIYLQTTGDVLISELINTIPNYASPAQVSIVKFVQGINQVNPPIPTFPTGEPGYTARSVLILPPPTNTHTLVLKGNDQDIGVGLHPTNPTFLSISNTPPYPLFIDYTGTTPIIVRFIWV